jgi:hypothetical protein
LIFFQNPGGVGRCLFPHLLLEPMFDSNIIISEKEKKMLVIAGVYR